MDSAEAFLNGSRWRLLVKDDGTWEIAKRANRWEWDAPTFGGHRGVAGVREGAEALRAHAALKDTHSEGAEMLEALAEIAESGRAA